MDHASPYVNFADSDEEDYVAIDEEDVSSGLQQVKDSVPVPEEPSVLPRPPRSEPFSSFDPAFGFCGGASSSSSFSGFGQPPAQSSGFGSSSGGFGGGFGAPSSFSAQLPPPPPSSFSFGSFKPAQGFSFGSSTAPATSSFSFAPQSAAEPQQPQVGRFHVSPPVGQIPPRPSDAVEALRLRRQRKKKKPPRGPSSIQKVNTNVISLKLGTLSDAASLATGDPVFCQNEKCKTILTSFNEINRDNDSDLKLDEGESSWICKFCGTRNVCDIDEEEHPQGESQDYILEPASHGTDNTDDSLVVFCVDVSGSMCVTTELQGRIQMKGNRLKDLQSLNEDGSNQYFARQRRDSTYVSRLQCVQAAIDDQLEELSKECPNQRVALVTFANEVTIYGDGSEGTQEIVAGDKLNSAEECQRVGSAFPVVSPISESREKLSKVLWEFEENGQTALGPALTVSIAIAAQRHRSRVVLCTDGLANVGLGSLDEVGDDAERLEEIGQWYENIGAEALNHGVAVNVVSITDDGCRLENLGAVADVSRGEVQRINPVDLTKNFRGILSKPVLATHVQATLFLHPGLKFRSQQNDLWSGFGGAAVPTVDSARDPASDAADAESPESDVIVVAKSTQDVGNVFEDSGLFFEYDVIKEKIREYRELDGLPFQVQISYTRLDGAKMMRVISQLKPVTTDREEVMQNMNYRVLSSNSLRKTGALCKNGDYESARVNTFKTAAWMSSQARTPVQSSFGSAYVRSNMQLDSMMQQQQQSEVSGGLSPYMASPSVAQRQSRRSQRSDGFSETMYGGAFGSSRGF